MLSLLLSGDSAAALAISATGEWLRAHCSPNPPATAKEAPPGTVAALVAALKRSPTDAALCGTACAAIASALEADHEPPGENRRRLASGATAEFWVAAGAGGVEILAAALGAHTDDAKVQVHAARALTLLLERLPSFSTVVSASLSVGAPEASTAGAAAASREIDFTEVIQAVARSGVFDDVIARTLGHSGCRVASSSGPSVPAVSGSDSSAAQPARRAAPADVIASHARLVNSLIMAHGDDLWLEDPSSLAQGSTWVDDDGTEVCMTHLLSVFELPGSPAALVRTLAGIIDGSPEGNPGDSLAGSAEVATLLLNMVRAPCDLLRAEECLEAGAAEALLKAARSAIGAGRCISNAAVYAPVLAVTQLLCRSAQNAYIEGGGVSAGGGGCATYRSRGSAGRGLWAWRRRNWRRFYSPSCASQMSRRPRRRRAGRRQQPLLTMPIGGGGAAV